MKARLLGLKDRKVGDIQVKAFGSATKGKANPNDFDIAVIVNDPKALNTPRIQKILKSIEDDFKVDSGGLPVDINIHSPSQIGPKTLFDRSDLVDF